MALPTLSSRKRKRDSIVAIDLGSRTTKAVHVQCKGARPSLVSFAIQDAPIYEKGLSPELLGEHLRSLLQALDAKTKTVTLAVGVNESILRNTELPQIPISEMRQMLKFNTKNYLQQDLPDHVFDCHIVIPKQGVKTEGPKGQSKLKVWVGGARRQLVDDIQAGLRAAGVGADQLSLGVVGPVNAFEAAFPDVFSSASVALVDLGFKNSSISILSDGELMLQRVVAIGGDRITAGLAESMGISYAEAEGIKVGMPGEVESSLSPLISPLGRELRASIDFFEHQHDRTVGEVYVSGGAARSEFIIQALQTELMVPCKSWNPTVFLDLALSPQQMGEIEYIAPQLTVALGTAVGSFN